MVIGNWRLDSPLAIWLIETDSVKTLYMAGAFKMISFYTKNEAHFLKQISLALRIRLRRSASYEKDVGQQDFVGLTP